MREPANDNGRPPVEVDEDLIDPATLDRLLSAFARYWASKFLEETKP